MSGNEWQWVFGNRMSRHRLCFVSPLQRMTRSGDVFLDKCSSGIDSISLSSLVYPLCFGGSSQWISLISLPLGRPWRPVSFLSLVALSLRITGIALAFRRRHHSPSLLDSLRCYWSFCFNECRLWFNSFSLVRSFIILNIFLLNKIIII